MVYSSFNHLTLKLKDIMILKFQNEKEKDVFFVLSRAPDSKIVPSLKKKRTSNLLIPRSSYTYQKTLPQNRKSFSVTDYRGSV